MTTCSLVPAEEDPWIQVFWIIAKHMLRSNLISSPLNITSDMGTNLYNIIDILLVINAWCST